MTEGNSKEGAATIVLPERVDSTTAAAVERTIMAALEPGAGLIVDGCEVSYMSAAGVRTLATVLHKAEDVKARLVFCRFTGAAADCLVVSGFNGLFDIAASTEEAHNRLKSKELSPPAERLHRPLTAG